MGIKEIMEKMISKDRDSPMDAIDDDQTHDKYLRSLRRERRLQMEEDEKEVLKKEISKFKTERTKKYMFGIDNRKDTDSTFRSGTGIIKKKSVKKVIMVRRKPVTTKQNTGISRTEVKFTPRRKKKNVSKNKECFYGKSNMF